MAVLLVVGMITVLPDEAYAATAVGKNTGVSSAEKNGWQVVSGGYAGYELYPADKTMETQDNLKLVQVQKNVVPTDVENEFLVYLSVATKMSWDDIMGKAVFTLTSSNGYVPGVEDKVKGNFTSFSADPTQSVGNNEYEVDFTLTDGSTIVYHYRGKMKGTTPNCSNGSFVMWLPGMAGKGGTKGAACICLQNNVNLGGGSGNLLTAKIDINTFKKLGFDYTPYVIDLSEVNGSIGSSLKPYESIEYLETLYSDGDLKVNGTDFHWDIEKNKLMPPEVAKDAKSGWMNNIAQAVYRIRLNTTPNKFVPCGDAKSSPGSTPQGAIYPVGKDTVLDWSKSIGTSSTSYVVTKTDMQTPFSEPSVRGVLYSIDINKVDPSGNKLNGAQFQMTGTLLRNNESYTSPIEKSDSGKNPMVRFTNLRTGGSYTLKEIKAPTGYYANPNSWTMAMNYTNANGDYKYNAATNTMQYTKLGNPLKITNQKAYGKLSISKTVVGSTADQAQDFTFTFKLYDDDYTPAQEITESYSYTGSKSGTIKSGDSITLKHGQSITINNIPASARYVVTETADDKFDMTSTGDTGLIEKDKTANAAFTNTRGKGDLVISKTVEPGLDTQNTEEFEFTLTLTDYDAPLTGTYQYTGSKTGTIGNGGTVKLRNGEHITVEGLPAGAEYAVAESESAKYVIKEVSNRTGEIPKNASITAAFVNEPKKEAKLYIKKVIDGDTTNLTDDEFIINVNGGAVDTDVVLKHNDTSSAILFKEDTTVSISEIIPMEYSMESIGVIEKGSTTETSLSESTYDIKLGDEVTIVVHNSYEYKPYFHDFDTVTNNFNH